MSPDPARWCPACAAYRVELRTTDPASGPACDRTCVDCGATYGRYAGGAIRAIVQRYAQRGAQA